ncbi:MAG: hypothetical protein D3909_12585, partial [Candidatus Electrothrix sp. ATG1]|nr:hypothetical protein [Candidatus Electrothrix sp. ATG1]
LKTLLQKKSGQDKKLLNAVHELEQDTSSDGRKMIVQEEVKKAGADKDPEIQAAASQLLDLLKEVQPEAVYNATQSGSGAIAQGKGSIAVGAGGIAVGGNVTGGINTSGRKDEEEEE